MLLVVQHILALIAARLGLIDLILARVSPSLAVVQVSLPVRELHGAREVRRVGGRSLLAELGLVLLERGLVHVGESLFAIGHALIEIRHRLLLIESRRPAPALGGVALVIHR
jgi:hypothetical protein